MKIFKRKRKENEDRILKAIYDIEKNITSKIKDSYSKREEALGEMVINIEARKITTYENQIKKLKNSIEVSGDLIRQQDEQIKELEKKVNNLTSSNGGLRASKNKLEKEIKELTEKYKGKLILEKLPPQKARNEQKMGTKASRVKTAGARKELKKLEELREAEINE